MGWKDWSAWVKGGVIFNILMLLISFSGWFLFGMNELNPFALFVFPGVSLLLGISDIGLVAITLVIIISILTYFIIGAIIGWIIGWIVGKIRNK